MTSVRRLVIGNNGKGQSAVVLRDSTNIQEVKDLYWRTTLWAASEFPVDNTIDGDRGDKIVDREPKGFFFRVDEFPPNMKDEQKRIQLMRETNKTVNQKYPPTPADMERDAGMHRTDTCDMVTVAYGELHLITDCDEEVIKAGDTVVVKGVNHAWSNKSDEPAMIIGVMVHADAWPAESYPAPGL